MTEETSKSFETCRILGLNSTRGQTWNGSIGLAADAAADDDDEKKDKNQRLHLAVPGTPEVLHVRRRNLEFVPPKALEYTLRVRHNTTIRDDEFLAELVEQHPDSSMDLSPMFPTKLSEKQQQHVRARGILQVLNSFFDDKSKGGTISRLFGRGNNKKSKAGKGETIVVYLQDLNLVRALNMGVTGHDEDKALDSQVKKLFDALSKAVLLHDCSFYAKHYIHVDDIHKEDAPGKGSERYEAVKNKGTFCIYPCPLENRPNCLEVRYTGSKGGSGHDIFEDFGASEATLYIRNAVGLHEVERLRPHVLAQVDFPMFWSTILHYEKCMQAMRNLRLFGTELVQEWEGLQKGIRLQNKRLTKLSKLVTEPALLPNKQGKYKIRDDAHAQSVGRAGFNVAMLLTIGECIYQTAEERENAVNELFHEYKGTDFEKLLRGFELQIQGKDEKKSMFAYYDKKDERPAALRSCQRCGKSEGTLKTCNRCKKVAYCGRECQRDAWKDHRKECKPVKK